MQTISFKNHTPVLGMQQKTENQYSPRRRDSIKCRTIFAAVREWEATLSGRAQEHVAQLVAQQWEKQNGRGISVNKQNLYRYLKTNLDQRSTPVTSCSFQERSLMRCLLRLRANTD